MTMIYAVSMYLYQNKKNGKDAFLALVDQSAVQDKLQKLLKDSTDILQNWRLSGKGKNVEQVHIVPS